MKKNPTGKIKLPCGRTGEWILEEGALRVRIHGEATEEELLEASNLVPQQIWDMHDRYWAKQIEGSAQ